MKRNSLNLFIGLLLLVVFGAMLFCFQVRQTEVVLITTFGKPTTTINADPDKPEPGLYFKWPWPIQKKQSFDKRIQNLESTFDQTYTADKQPLITTVYCGWTITQPALFRERFAESKERAAAALESIVRQANHAVVGQHAFAHFISTDETQMKLGDIEKEILLRVQPLARDYGMEVRFLGIKRLGLPESISEKIFARMREERQRYVQKLSAEGDLRARDIRSAAERERTETLAKASARVTEILGQADSEVARSLAVFKDNPDFAIFLLKIGALEESLTNRSTLILDERTPPFDLLKGGAQPMTK
jgi:membrane protease subunit HflC